MNFLILNWRDIKNPLSGGAEILTHELGKGLVKKGHKVIQFSSYFKGAKKKEVIDGVEIIREGNPDARFLFSSVQFKAFRYYKKNLQGNVDYVVDEIHGVPFFTPFYVKEKKIVLICEIAGSIWDLAVAFPFNKFGKILEKIYPNFYKSIPLITISNSSKIEMVKTGFPRENIHVIQLGCSVPIFKKIPQKEGSPTVIFIARLSKTKGIEDAINAIKLLKNKIPNIKLWVVGRGSKDYILKLEEIIKKRKLEENIKIFGYISEKGKQLLLRKAHILIAPSKKEGWGLTVHEAGSYGVPSIVYNVGGLKDVVKDGVNGIICNRNTPADLAKNIEVLFKNKKFYEKLQKGSREERKKYTWGKTLQDFRQVLK